MLQLYKNIKSRRSELHLTQSDLASKMGYADKSMIAKIEKGLVDLPQSKIFAFAKVLETTPSELMGQEQIDSESSKEEQKELISICKELSSENQNKVLQYSKNLLTNQQLEEEVMPNAACDNGATPEQKANADSIMQNPKEWT